MSLFNEIKIGSLLAKNRIALAPMTRARYGEDGVPKELNAEYFRQRSSAGLLITDATGISKEGLGWWLAPGIFSDSQVEGWKIVTNAVHNSGSLIYLQLWHMGRQSHSSLFGIHPVAPSAIKVNGETHIRGSKVPYEVPRALEASELPRIVEDYINAAKNAKAAGFDGVEIHGANGYLLDTFLQSSTNLRTDNYGGSIENRFRLVREVIEGIKTVFPAEQIGIRFSPNGVYGDMGSADNFETFSYAVTEVGKLGLGYVHIMDGLGWGFHGKDKVFRLYDARRLFDKVIIGNLGYTKDKAEGAIDGGVADLIAFGRPFITNPDLVERFKGNLPLAPDPDYSKWYYGGVGDESVGYTDFPKYEAK